MKSKSIQLKSIQQKITLWAGLCLLLAAATIITSSAFATRAQALAGAREQALARARVEAAKVKAQIDTAFDACRTLNHALKSVKDKSHPLKLDRDGANAILRKTLEENPQFLGTYTLWESNEFDGRDSEYVNARGHDKTGRFIPYWVRNEKSEIILEPLVDYEVEGAGDWYLVPKRTQKESIVGPLVYPVAGQPVLMNSQLVPLMVDGKFRGITGVDLRLDFVQGLVDRVNLYNGTGKMVLINNQGVIAGMTRRPELAAKSLNEAKLGLEEGLPGIKSGQEAVEQTAERLSVRVPIILGRTETPWAVCLLIPLSEIAAPVTAQVWRQIGIGLLMIAIALSLLWLLAGRLAQPIKAAATFADDVANGRPVEKIPVSTADETGQLVQAMNNMLDSNSTLLQSREERDRIQQSIMKLLDDVSGVAQGDLTREADVTTDVTGAIADSFNFMILELRRIIGKVQQVASEVNSSATTTQQTTQQLAEEANERASQIVRASQELDTMAYSIRRVSETAETSRTVAQQSLETAQRGAEVVQSTIKSMTSLREQVQETAKRIKRLGDNSQEIGEIVQLIGDIAHRTSVLALNASIQAARAGDAGRGFAVVAEEVERLAKSSADATKRINELVKTAKVGANEAIAAMEESTRGVVEGTTLVYQAGSALSEIEAVSAQLAELIQSISQATERQANESEGVSQAMLALSSATQRTAAGIEQSALSVTQLAALADDLNLSVASFKLSNGYQQSPAPGRANGSANGRRPSQRFELN